MTRATWADFVRWVADRYGDDDYAGLLGLVETERDATIAIVSAYATVVQANLLQEEWLSSLRERGIEPPEDAPTVASALEEVANKLVERRDFCDTAAQTWAGSDGACVAFFSKASAFDEAVAMLRARAKEAT